jgi:hypothetical protein
MVNGKFVTFVGWLRKDKRSAWRAVASGSSYAKVEAALAEIPTTGRREESQILQQGIKPIGPVERGGKG